jgi:citrate synthase
MATARSDGSAGGLEGVVVADTRLSDVDGERGRLILAGHDAEELGGRISFEEVCALLWSVDADRLREQLADARVEAFARVKSLGGALALADGMSALRAALGQLTPSDMDEAIALVAGTAVFAAAWARTRAGASPVAPDSKLSHAADYLNMLQGRPPDPSRARELDTYVVTVSDHGLNASTFAARVVASTGSDMVSAIVAAVGALKGPLHGGAPGPVLDMLDAIGKPERARAWIDAELAAGRRIMGMGHRIYRVRDPRAAIFEKAIERLAASGTDAKERLALARAVEHEAEESLRAKHPERPLRANVEFFTAVLLEALGIPRAAFTPTFAVGRVAGWCAHVLEQRATGRLIRPASRYVGQTPGAGTGDPPR